MSSLPDELYHEILLRAPVKFAYACKCICKTWFNVVSDRSFIKSHLVRISQKNNPNLMHGRYDNSKNIDLICALSYDSLILNGLGDDLVNTVVQTGYPSTSSDCVVELIGSCNGMVCLVLHHGNGTNLFCVIWNPATNEHKKVIKLQLLREDYLGQIGFAFGYDSKTDDYKLAIVNTRSSLFHVYTLGSNSFKTFQYFLNWFSSEKQGVLFNGALHLLSTVDDYEAITTFDTCEKSFNEILLPKEATVNRYRFMSVGTFEGCLCMLVRGKASIGVWVMREYGIRKTWSKRFSITDERIMKSYKLSLVYSFKNGQMLFSADICKLFSYDPKNGSVTELNIQTGSIFGSEDVCFNLR